MAAAEFSSIQKSRELLRSYYIYSPWEHSVLNRLPVSLKQIMLVSSRKDLWSFSVLDVSHEMPADGKTECASWRNYRCILFSAGTELISSRDNTMF